MVMDEVGLVDNGLMILAITIVDVVLAAREVGTHPFNLNFIVDSTVIEQPLIKVAPDLKEVKATLAELLN